MTRLLVLLALVLAVLAVFFAVQPAVFPTSGMGKADSAWWRMSNQ